MKEKWKQYTVMTARRGDLGYKKTSFQKKVSGWFIIKSTEKRLTEPEFEVTLFSELF